jgi:hypothetical protein
VKERMKIIGIIKPTQLIISTWTGCASIPPSNTRRRSRSSKNIDQVMKNPKSAKDKLK